MTQIIKTFMKKISLDPTLIAEESPDNCVDTLSTQKNNKVLVQTYITAKPYHKHTNPVVCKVG